LVGIEPDQFLAPQSSRQQYKDDRTITPGTPRPMNRNISYINPGTAFQLMEAWQTVTEVLERPHLFF
jgi:hypothetical protein